MVGEVEWRGWRGVLEGWSGGGGGGGGWDPLIQKRLGGPGPKPTEVAQAVGHFLIHTFNIVTVHRPNPANQPAATHCSADVFLICFDPK